MDNFGLNVTPEGAAHVQALTGGLMSPNNDERRAAEEQYNNHKEQNPEQLLSTLLYLSACSSEMNIRSMCALMFRKEVVIPTSDDAVWPWKASSPAAQQAIKAALLTIFAQGDLTFDIRKKLNDALSSLAITVLKMADNSWPELLPYLLGLSENENPEIRAAALEILGTLANRVSEYLESHFDNFLPFLAKILSDPSAKVRVSTFLLIYGLLAMVEEKSEEMQRLQGLGPGVLEAITLCLQSNDFESGSLGMEYLVEMVELSPKFFRPNMMKLIELMFQITKSDQLEDSIRQLGVETMVTLAETKPGMVRKIPNFMEGIIGLLLEWGTRIEDNEDWNKGEEEDLDDVDAAVAEESLDRLSIAMGGATLVPVLFSAVPVFLGSEDWHKRYSGLLAISVCGEGSANYLLQHLDKVVGMVLPFCKDPNPRVRWAACNTIGQMCTDFQPHIQITHANDILGALIPVFDDSANPRVQSHAASAIVNFCEECSEQLIAPFLKPILEKLHGLLQSPKIVQEQVITAVAALADASKEQFRPFYGYFMPFLKDVLKTAVSKEYLLLRCKAMECASIVGVAVGKEIFGQDANEIIDLLNNLEIASDPEMPSMHMAWARLCKCLGTDFKPYLDMCMPKLLELAKIEPEIQIVDSEQIDDYTEGWEVLPLREDAIICIKTSEAEDKSTAINIIFCFADEMEGHFFPYVQPVAQLMANSLTFPYHDAVRNTAASCCPCLITSTIAHLTATGQDMRPAVELWNFLQTPLLKAIKKEIDVEAHVSMLEAYSECIDLIGENSHNPETLKSAHEVLYKILGKYLKARANRSKSRGEGEEDFDEFEAEKLENMTERDDDVIGLITELTGKLFKVYKANYLPIFLEGNGKVWKEFITPNGRPRDIQMGLCIFDDMAEHLGETVTPHVQDLFQAYGALCTNEVPDVRQAAVYGLGLFAQYCGQAFGPLANTAANALCQVSSAENARAVENVHATENAVSSLGKICLYQAESINLAKFVQAFVSFLPVSEDKEESRVTYSTLCALLDRDPQTVLGADFANLPAILRLFGGILWSDLVDDAAMEKVVASIKRLEAGNQKMFQEACGALDEDQRAKVLRASAL